MDVKRLEAASGARDDLTRALEHGVLVLSLFIQRIDKSAFFEFLDESQLDKVRRARVFASVAEGLQNRLDAL